MTLEITIRQQAFVLHCSGAIFWKSQQMLLISDVHLGKVAHFRRHGLALPPDSAAGNFKQLTSVADHFQAQTICFLGDLFHSKLNNEWFAFEDWVNSRNEKIVLVSGNHDIISPTMYTAIGVEVLPEKIVNTFLLTHEPEIREGLFTFCGHIHPGIRLHGTGRQLLQLPCFFQTEDQLILPAFGEFTGKFILNPAENDRVYVITKEEVIFIKNNQTGTP